VVLVYFSSDGGLYCRTEDFLEALMTDDLHSGTTDGLLRFLDYAGEKGLVNQTTSQARKSACIKILEIDGLGWRDRKVADIDTDSQFERFSRKSGSRYTPGSLATYGQRFRDAVAEYQAFLANPTGFKGHPTRRTGKATTESKTTKRAGKQIESPPGRSHSQELITYPFPLEGGALGYVQLPREIRESDAERLCNFIRSLALQQTGPGNDDKRGA